MRRRRDETMARISFDNGNSYLDPTDDRDEIMEGLEGHDWDAIVTLMDDDMREETHSAFEYDEGDKLLLRFKDMGLITAEDVEYRRNAIKTFRLQRTFDNVFNVKEKEQ
jgi:hypothetical protein